MLDTFVAKLQNAYKSWTVWFNGVMAMVGFALPALLNQLPLVSAYLPPSIYGWMMLVTIVGNIALRFKTSVPLEAK